MTGALAAAVQRLAKGQADQAQALLQGWIDAHPTDAAAWQWLGLAHLQQNATEPAQVALQQALTLAPDNPRTLALLAVACMQAGAPAQALAHFDRAVTLAPAQPDLWHDRGKALFEAGRPQDALLSFERCLALAPGHAQAWLNRGNMLRELGRWDEALTSLSTAARLAPRDALVLRAVGETLQQAGRPREALVAYEHALQRDPDDATTACTLMYLKQQQVDWRELEPLFTQTLMHLDGTRSGVASWAMLSHPDASAAQLRRGAQAQARTLRAQLARQPAWVARARTSQRLRIGYLSADFREHAMAYLMAGVFEQHDRAAFEVVGIDLHRPPTPTSPMRERLLRAFDRFTDASDPLLGATLRRVRALELDVVVDLMGLTRDARPELLMHRVAPIQVGYLGFPGTSGMHELDYILGDRWVTPVGADADFCENVVRLPGSFQANDHCRSVPAPPPARSALGLPNDGFVFCCFNSAPKIGPRVFDAWMRLLSRLPSSVLWLVDEGEHVRQNLRAQAQQRGVRPQRLVFAPRQPYAQHLARLQQADLFLDTLPFNAGTTASDALWAGVPLLTQLGTPFAGRMAASLLDAVGLPELITRNAAAYEALALQLATDPARLQALRSHLRAARLTSALFDTVRFTRQLESAYQTMWRRHAQGLPPTGFDVATR